MSSVVSSAHPQTAAALSNAASGAAPAARDEEESIFFGRAGQVKLTSEDRQAGYALPSTFEERKPTTTVEPIIETPYASRAADSAEYAHTTGKTRWVDDQESREHGKTMNHHASTRRHKDSSRHGHGHRHRRRKPKELAWWQKPRPLILVVIFVLVIALGVGLGVGLGVKRDDAATQAIGGNNNQSGAPSPEPSAPGNFPSISASSRATSSVEQPAVSVSNDGNVGPIGPQTDAINNVVAPSLPTSTPVGLMTMRRRR
ncbi:hypothetical protein ACM66B_006870 [Microbotryomycetes sp. NB124-2]